MWPRKGFRHADRGSHLLLGDLLCIFELSPKCESGGIRDTSMLWHVCSLHLSLHLCCIYNALSMFGLTLHPQLTPLLYIHRTN